MVDVNLREPFHMFNQDNGLDPERELSAAEQAQANYATANLYGLGAVQGLQTVAMNSLPFLRRSSRRARRVA